jgi:hypothetical protein
VDLAEATGNPEWITLGGDEYPVRLLRMEEWGAVTSWLKRENPSPVTRAALAISQAQQAGEPLTAEAEEKLLDHAQRAALSWPPKVGTPEWFDAIERVEGGMKKLLHEVLSRTDPAFTTERAEALAPRVSRPEWGELIRVSLFGGAPRPKDDGARSGPDPPRSGTNGAPSSMHSSVDTVSTPRDSGS